MKRRSAWVSYALLCALCTSCGTLIGEDFSGYRGRSRSNAGNGGQPHNPGNAGKNAGATGGLFSGGSDGPGEQGGGPHVAGSGGSGSAGSGGWPGGASGSGGWGSTAGSGGSSGSGGVGGSADGGSGGSGGTVGGTGGQGGISGSAGNISGEHNSCQNLRPNCGLTGTADCCAVSWIPGGKFYMGRDNPEDIAFAKAAIPRHSVELNRFGMDTFEATVARFRNFVNIYDAWRRPTTGAGQVWGQPQSGWNKDWNTLLPRNSELLRERLECVGEGVTDSKSTWTDEPGLNETKPINCVSWQLAFAFCIWDGARLPTEAEWEYVAAGGMLEFDYPWGKVFNVAKLNFANYGEPVRVGWVGEGSGRSLFGTYDLAGNVWEWVRDVFDPAFYGTPSAIGSNPLNPFDPLLPGTYPVRRGASYLADDPIRATSWHRDNWPYDKHSDTIGFRCVREAEPQSTPGVTPFRSSVEERARSRN